MKPFDYFKLSDEERRKINIATLNKYHLLTNKKNMNNLIVFLQGKKSYIVAVIMAIFTLGKVFGWINTTAEQDTAIYGVLATLFGVSLKAGIDRELGKAQK